MGDQISERRSRQARRLVRRQHGVIARRQLISLGFSPKAIKHRVSTGRLHPVLRGVYAVGRANLTREGRWVTAVLACGAGSAVSHRSAAALWGFAAEHRDYIDVSVRRSSESRLSGVRCHRRPLLPSAEITTHLDIPVTSPVRTFLDLATVAGPRTVERAINEADKLGIIAADALRRALDNYPGAPGVRALRRILDRDTFLLSDTELEVLFRPIARSAGLPEPLTKQMVNGFEVDFFWSELGLVVETDGWRYHRTPSAQARDALRDQTHTATGMTTLRFAHYQVKYEPDYVRGVLEATAANLSGRPAPAPGR